MAGQNTRIQEQLETRGNQSPDISTHLRHQRVISPLSLSSIHTPVLCLSCVLAALASPQHTCKWLEVFLSSLGSSQNSVKNEPGPPSHMPSRSRILARPPTCNSLLIYLVIRDIPGLVCMSLKEQESMFMFSLLPYLVTFDHSGDYCMICQRQWIGLVSPITGRSYLYFS